MIKLLWHSAIANVQIFANQWLSPRLQNKFAERRVIKEIHRAYKNVPYYRKKYDEAGIKIDSINTLKDLKRLPFLTKDEVREEFPNGIVARNTDIKKCHYSATTGSTGRSLPFIFSPATFAYYLVTSFRKNLMTGYRPWHKLVYVKYTPVNTPSFGPFFRQAHIPSVITVEEQIEMLKKEKPDLLLGYASIILEIAQRVTEEDLREFKPKFISVNSELSTQEQRDYISSVFGCPVLDEYSTEETWMVAVQCLKGNYHIFIDNVWVEFLNENGNDAEPGESGEIFLTTMRSPVMPFIRYKIGDMGRPSDGKCSCGSRFPILESFDGRADDSFVLPSGKFISSLKLLNTFTMYIKKYLHLMDEFKLIQKERDQIVVKLVKGKEYSDEKFNEVIFSLKKILNEPVTIKVEFTDKIPSQGIKRKAIESLVNKGSSNNYLKKEAGASTVI